MSNYMIVYFILIVFFCWCHVFNEFLKRLLKLKFWKLTVFFVGVPNGSGIFVLTKKNKKILLIKKKKSFNSLETIS